MGMVQAMVKNPRGSAKGVHHYQRQDREEDDHDDEDRDHSRHSRDPVDFLLGHLPQRLPVAAERAAEDGEVLDRPREHHSDHDPDRSREVAELRRERRPHEGSGAGDGGEMVPEKHPAVRGDEVAAVVQPLGRSRPAIVELENLAGDEESVEPVADRVGTDGGREEPDGIDAFSTAEGHDSEGRRAENGNRGPDEERCDSS
jgi:hypothetical protein